MLCRAIKCLCNKRSGVPNAGVWRPCELHEFAESLFVEDLLSLHNLLDLVGEVIDQVLEGFCPAHGLGPYVFVLLKGSRKRDLLIQNRRHLADGLQDEVLPNLSSRSLRRLKRGIHRVICWLWF